MDKRCEWELGPCEECDFHNAGWHECEVEWERGIFKRETKRLAADLKTKATPEGLYDAIVDATVSMHWAIYDDIGWPPEEAELVAWIEKWVKDWKKGEEEDDDTA